MLAELVKLGVITRNEAINIYREGNGGTFGNAVCEIDIAIGNLNSGEE
jgi:hypothetical protein